MIDFFNEGSQIGFTINGISGFFLIIYILLELIFIIHTRTLLVHSLFLSIRVRYEVKKIIPKWWYVEKVSYFSIRMENGISIIDPLLSSWSIKYPEYKVYVKVRSKISTGGRQIYGDNTCYADDLIKLNWLGKIKNENLVSWIESEDDRHQKEIKQWLRNKSLEDIGI